MISRKLYSDLLQAGKETAFDISGLPPGEEGGGDLHFCVPGTSWVGPKKRLEVIGFPHRLSQSLMKEKNKDSRVSTLLRRPWLAPEGEK